LPPTNCPAVYHKLPLLHKNTANKRAGSGNSYPKAEKE